MGHLRKLLARLGRAFLTSPVELIAYQAGSRDSDHLDCRSRRNEGFGDSHTMVYAAAVSATDRATGL